MKPFPMDMPSDRRAAYDGKISSQEWADVRDEVLLRDGFKCQICGCKHDLQVHHVNYDDFLDTGNLVTLCRPCHEIVTGMVNRVRETAVSADLPGTFRADRWHDEEMWVIRMMESALYKTYQSLIANAILALWKRSMKEECQVNLKQPDAIKQAGNILTRSVEGQTGLRGFGEVTYVSEAIDRITEYTAKAYDHYASEGMSDSEFARMFRIRPENMWKVKRNAEKIRSGGADGG